MPRNFTVLRMVLISDIALGVAIMAWSLWRQQECGSDCRLFESVEGISTTIGWYIGLGLTTISIVSLLVIHKLIPSKD